MVIADCLVLNCTDHKEFYRELKVYDAMTTKSEDIDMIIRI